MLVFVINQQGKIFMDREEIVKEFKIKRTKAFYENYPSDATLHYDAMLDERKEFMDSLIKDFQQKTSLKSVDTKKMWKLLDEDKLQSLNISENTANEEIIIPLDIEYEFFKYNDLIFLRLMFVDNINPWSGEGDYWFKIGCSVEEVLEEFLDPLLSFELCCIATFEDEGEVKIYTANDGYGIEEKIISRESPQAEYFMKYFVFEKYNAFYILFFEEF